VYVLVQQFVAKLSPVVLNGNVDTIGVANVFPVGAGVTVSVTDDVIVQPFASVPCTVYVVVAVTDDAVTLAVLVAFRKVAGLQAMLAKPGAGAAPPLTLIV
jgi:hypothetical protein